MNRSEFMEKLAAALKASQSDETVQTLLADFNDHFDEALKAGQSEAEICAMLGDPAEIAAECAEELSRDDAALNDMPTDDAGVYISLDQMDLRCEACDGDEFRVEVRHNNKVVQDDTVTVKQTKHSLQVIQMREQDFVRRLFHSFRFIEVYVRIPRRFAGDLSVKMTSGNARIDGVSITGNLRCELTSGNMVALKVSAGGALAAISRSGNIIIDSCQGDLSADCHSGNIRVKAHKGNVLRAAATSGNVKVEAGCIEKDCALAVTSGNVHIDLDKLGADLNLECRSGNIKFSVRELHGNITGKARSGNITGALSRDTRAVFSLQSAGAHNPFPNAAIPDAGVPVVTLTSRSGNVNIKEL